MSIWSDPDGKIRVDIEGNPMTAPAWWYRPKFSDCVPWIVLIGCDPPLCVEYSNTALGIEDQRYLRQNCWEWSGTSYYGRPAYAWDDVSDCPWPEGVSIEEAEDCGDLIELKINITGALFTVWARDTLSPFSTCVSIKNQPSHCGDSGYYCWEKTFPNPFARDLVRNNSGWLYYFQDTGYWPETISIPVSCNGGVSFYWYPGFHWAGIYYAGSGTIALDADDLPIGSTTFDVVSGQIDGRLCAGTEPIGDVVGSLTVEVSEQ